MDSFQSNTAWLDGVLEEVGLKQFLPRLTNDLQLTKLSHFDYVTEDDLIQLALKNRIVNKLIPLANSTPTPSSKSLRSHNDLLVGNIANGHGSGSSDNDTEFSRLTCLINSQDVQIKEEIGHGVHGFVKKGEWTAPNGRVIEVALKILRKDVMSEPGASFNDFVKEISVMHQLNHPNIIKLYGVVLSSPMMMVTELAPLGNLRDRLKKENGQTPIAQLINFGVQIASGMDYLDSRRFVHRDLAARNIFISHGKKILIGDLGLMRAIPSQENHYVMSERTKIPYPWCAPESLKLKQFSSSSDVYMFGVTLWEMFSFGKEPWAGLNMNEIIENISSQKQRLTCPEACPTMVYQTLLQCWNVDPNLRPKFSTLYQYLSTSYPLEVISTQHISEIGQKRLDGQLIPDDLKDTSSVSSSHTEGTKESKTAYRQVLNCSVDDKILVIDGQPEKYWWKGQNQRTFEIGWFPLCSTRWLAPKKGFGSNCISRPLKNSFVHTGHCGSDGIWGSPRFIDHMYLKNPLEPDDLNAFGASSSTRNRLNNSSIFPKHKTKSRLSRLFGINEPASQVSTAHLLTHSYQKFNNEPQTNSRRNVDNSMDHTFKGLASSGLSCHEDKAEEPPLIDLRDECTIPNSQSLLISGDDLKIQQESLIDIENPFHIPSESLQRHSSDTQLNKVTDTNDYQLSWAGSWNTGTFDGSNSNIYSAYYCPQDAALSGNVENDGNRYYSAVTHEEDRSNK